MIPADQTLYCVYSGTSGSNTYVTVYNNENETSISAPTSYRFTCLVYSVSDSSISMTTNPEECLTTTLQTPTSISSTYGQIVNFTDIASTLLVLALIIAIIIIIICCIKRRRKRRPVPDEEQQIKEDEKDEARENADDMDGEKKDQVQTKTEEEEDDQRSVDSGFIPDRIDKEEQEKADQEQKNEEEVRAEGDGEKDDKDRPDTVQSRMSDLGRSIAPSDGLSPRDDSPGPAGDHPEQHGSDSEGSTADSDDPSEIERRIQMVGMKKQGQQYVPDGELSKVLVTRDMEEKARLKKMKGKRGRGMQKYGKGKSKKQQDNRDKAGTPDSKTEVERLKGHGGVKAEFMEQYHHKKKIEKKLDDEHYWSEEDDKIDNLRIDDLDDEFEASFPEEKIKVENDVVVIEVKDGSDISMADENEANKQNEQDKDREKDSGNDSPGVEQTTRDVDNDVNIDSDPDMADVEEFDDGMDEVYVRGTGRLPPGFIRDPQGRIIRIADGQIITEDEMEKLFKKARIKRLFNIARLKRNKKGRPIGGFIDDDYGPEIKQNDRNQAEDNLDNQEGPKRKQSRSSATHRLGGPVDRPRKSQGFIDFPGPRTVGFDVDDVSDIIKIDDDSDELKKKGGQFIFVNGADENPRELNSLVKVYGRHGTPYGMQESRPFGGPNLSRTESGRGQMNAEKLQNFRQGLANDRKFLDRKGPGLPVREAFGGGGDLTVEDLSEDDRQLELGSEDEFILVGGNRAKSGNQNEPLFTILRRPDELPGKNGSNGNPGPWCTRHDLRHSIPWSLRVENGHPGISRAHTGLHDESDNSNNAFGLPKSADHKRNLDDRRLREILEELYKDKKYFDHVIDTTGDNDVNLIIDERDLAEHGRDRLLDKADVWEQKQRENPAPLPPWLVPSRMNTAFRLESGRGSQISQTSTATPPIYENYRQKTAPNLTQEVIPEASTPPMRNSTPDAKNWGRSLSGKEQRDSKPNIDEIIIDADHKGNSKDNDNTNTPLPGQQLEESQSQNENTMHAQFIAPANSAASFSMPPGKNETQC
ncbi:hypothetical protein FSP39_023883 [Pinctada imbricata]|uniref:Uncharacterized protein n=1 Tax=Pinctada imbricata TaxID=66713 RepID=A0AA88YFR4_PINIB|nr:hypothetical protein FSP39_023883 [Pinctada imbricata]